MKTIIIALTVATATLAATAADTAAVTKPNIVYIVSDEIAYFEPGFMGGKDLHTPNLDRLAASGVIFRNLLSGGPNCAPARGALLTGKHSGHGSVRENSGDNAIRADEKTIGDVLKPLGYAVGGLANGASAGATQRACRRSMASTCSSATTIRRKRTPIIRHI